MLTYILIKVIYRSVNIFNMKCCNLIEEYLGSRYICSIYIYIRIDDLQIIYTLYVWEVFVIDELSQY